MKSNLQQLHFQQPHASCSLLVLPRALITRPPALIGVSVDNRPPADGAREFGRTGYRFTHVWNKLFTQNQTKIKNRMKCTCTSLTCFIADFIDLFFFNQWPLWPDSLQGFCHFCSNHTAGSGFNLSSPLTGPHCSEVMWPHLSTLQLWQKSV